MLAWLLISAVTAVSSAAWAPDVPGDAGVDLKRGAFFGAKVGSISDEARENLRESYAGHALAIWGKADFVSNEDDHALVARIVNRDHPGQGTYLAMNGIDHGFNRAASRRKSFERGQSRQPGEFNPAIIEVSRTWVEKLAAPPTASPPRAG